MILIMTECATSDIFPTLDLGYPKIKVIPYPHSERYSKEGVMDLPLGVDQGVRVREPEMERKGRQTPVVGWSLCILVERDCVVACHASHVCSKGQSAA